MEQKTELEDFGKIIDTALVVLLANVAGCWKTV